MPLRLYNTLTRRKEIFEPIDPQNVRLYACGPTVYDYLHIGNGRMLIAFDVLFRLLCHLYGESHVTYVRNITDVDDKINARAAERGIDIRVLTEEMTAVFHEDAKALGCLPPTFEPRATEHIPGTSPLSKSSSRRTMPMWLRGMCCSMSTRCLLTAGFRDDRSTI